MKPPCGASTAREAMLTTRPPPPAIMTGSTARQAMTVEVRLSAIMRSHSASGVDEQVAPREAAHRVDEAVHPAVPVAHRLDELLHRVLAGHVGGQGEQARPQLRGEPRLEPLELLGHRVGDGHASRRPRAGWW